MPGPDPDAIELFTDGSRKVVYYDRYFWTGNTGNREKRAKEILRRAIAGDWVCNWCGDKLPVWRRADAQYCSESCRKKAARERRKADNEAGLGIGRLSR